ncbi:hypothetical protein AAHA92_17835 [Salvia divinorum]|uniref:SWIM-type domain-containing protein n=1 Tax=Salvia divinorum TaxID=28513 RepID=A0ABD1H0K1_SALDI
MDGDLGSDSDIDINLEELDDILTFEDNDIDLADDINIDELNNGMNTIPLYANVWEDERNGDDGRDEMINEYEFDENMDKEDDIWAEGEGEGSESDGMVSIHSSDEEARSRWHVFNAKRDMKDPKFRHGMLFTNKEVLKQAIRQYAIVNKYNVKVVRDEKDRVNANCLNCEGWMIRASTNKKEKAFQIKKFKDNHKCALEIPQRYITYKWLSKTYKEHLRADPKFSSKSLAHQLERIQGLIAALDELMPHAEKRFCGKVAHKYTGAICPKIIKKLEKYKGLSSNCWATEAGARKYSVAVWEKLYVVNLDAYTCSCRQWQLSGIPCQHSIPCILQERRNPEEFVYEYYSLDRFKAAYRYVINPLRDIDDYEPTGYIPVQPPPVKVKKERKQKRRRKTIDEQVCKVAKDGTKIVGNTGQVKGNCSKCGGQGHNKRTCGRQGSQASQGNVREDRSEVCVSMIMRRSKLVVRRKSANTSHEHQDISSQTSNVEN